MSVFEDPFVSCCLFFSDSTVWDGRAETPPAVGLPPSPSLTVISLYWLAILVGLCMTRAVYPTLHPFLGARMTLNLFHHRCVPERRPQFALFLEGMPSFFLSCCIIYTWYARKVVVVHAWVLMGFRGVDFFVGSQWSLVFF